MFDHKPSHEASFIDDAIALNQQIIENEREQLKLRQELARSLAMEKLWPGVFKEGLVVARLIGRWQDKSDLAFEVRVGRTFKVFELSEVPAALLVPHLEMLREDIKRGKASYELPRFEAMYKEELKRGG